MDMRENIGGKTCARQIRESFDGIPFRFNSGNLVNSAQVAYKLVSK